MASDRDGGRESPLLECFGQCPSGSSRVPKHELYNSTQCMLGVLECELCDCNIFESSGRHVGLVGMMDKLADDTQRFVPEK